MEFHALMLLLAELLLLKSVLELVDLLLLRLFFPFFFHCCHRRLTYGSGQLCL